MEQKFTTDELEQFLRQEADNFKMVPSRNVWRGIYNDIHPGRRWPSITVGLLLVSTLVFIGHMNTPESSAARTLKHQATAGRHSITPGILQADITKSEARVPRKTGGMQDPMPASDRSSGVAAPVTTVTAASGTGRDSEDFPPTLPASPENGQQATAYNGFTPLPTGTYTWQESNAVILPDATAASPEMTGKESQKTGKILTGSPVAYATDDPAKSTQRDIAYPAVAWNNVNRSNIQAGTAGHATPATDAGRRGGIASTAQKSKHNDRITYTYFMAPSVASVAFRGAPVSPSVFLSTSVSILPSSYKVLNHPALGFEAGAQMNYAFAPKWKFTTGLHFSYSGYNIRSNEMHPTVAMLILKNPDSYYSRQYVSHYGDGTGLTPVNIKNYSVQLSLPVGLQYQFYSGDHVQLNASADIEPSLILGSYAYLLSSDGRNYVNDPSLMRKSNMASNLGIFLSFGARKVSWQVGPVLRYQWFSTYKKDYTVSEHLLNYGIRIGITPFRK